MVCAARHILKNKSVKPVYVVTEVRFHCVEMMITMPVHGDGDSDEHDYDNANDDDVIMKSVMMTRIAALFLLLVLFYSQFDTPKHNAWKTCTAVL